jgi:hypothetical protein
MSRLVGGIPRAYRDHRRKESAAYSEYVRALLDRLGPLPKSARPLLKEAGLITVDLERLRADQGRALNRNRSGEARRIDRRLLPLRTQLLTIELRLEALADRRNGHGDPLDQVLADLRRGAGA